MFRHHGCLQTPRQRINAWTLCQPGGCSDWQSQWGLVFFLAKIDHQLQTDGQNVKLLTSDGITVLVESDGIIDEVCNQRAVVAHEAEHDVCGSVRGCTTQLTESEVRNKSRQFIR